MRWHKAGYNKLAKEVTRYYSAPPAEAVLKFQGSYFTLQVFSGAKAWEIWDFGSNYAGDWAKAMRRANAILHAEHWY